MSRLEEQARRRLRDRRRARARTGSGTRPRRTRRTGSRRLDGGCGSRGRGRSRRQPDRPPPGTTPSLPEVWSGSHLDSVPQGGRYDGPLGVARGARGGRASRPQAQDARRRRVPGRGARLRRQPRARRARRPPGAYVELHHEQGPRLALAGAPLAVVTGIVGYVRAERVVEGRAGHAGTTPMDARDDALVSAAEEILRIRDVAESIDGAVATVGRIEAEPGGINVIPGRVRFTIDARAPDDERLDRLMSELGIDPAGRLRPPPSPAWRRRLAGSDRGTWAAAGRARLGCGSRRRGARARRGSLGDALRRGAERRRQPLAGRAVLAGGRGARGRRAGRHARPPRLRSDRYASRNTISCAPSQRNFRPSSRRFSFPSTTVAKWFPASCPAFDAKLT